MTAIAIETKPTPAVPDRCESQSSPNSGRCAEPAIRTRTVSCPCDHTATRAVCDLHDQHLHDGDAGCIKCWQAGHICRITPEAERA